MALNLVSNSGLQGNKGSKAISGIGAGGVNWLEIDESNTSGATISTIVDEYGVSWREARWLTPGSQTLSLGSGYCQLLVVAGGGGGGGWGCGGTDYAGGYGGSGGFYYQPMQFFEKGSYSITIGTGGNGGANQATGTQGGNSVIAGVVTCGGGGYGVQGCNGAQPAGTAGSFGGRTSGGRGSNGSSPGVGNNNNVSYDVNLWNETWCYEGSAVRGFGGPPSSKNTSNGTGGPGAIVVRTLFVP